MIHSKEEIEKKAAKLVRDFCGRGDVDLAPHAREGLHYLAKCLVLNVEQATHDRTVRRVKRRLGELVDVAALDISLTR
jgi:hypothetical protein